jgi:hypothetical protein
MGTSLAHDTSDAANLRREVGGVKHLRHEPRALAIPIILRTAQSATVLLKGRRALGAD